MIVLGVRCGHDASAALIIDGAIVANVAEERLTRIKNDSSFPVKSIKACLELGAITAKDVDVLAIPFSYIPDDFFVFFEMPLEKKKTIKSTLLSRIKNKFRSSPIQEDEPTTLPLYCHKFKLNVQCKVHLCEHHRAHAASAYFTSGFTHEKVLIATMDGVGGGVCAAIWQGENGIITNRYKVDGTGSLGWFYSNVTEALGWRHGSGEWKVMGLAPYGKSAPGIFDGYFPVFDQGKLVIPHNYGNFETMNDHGANHYHGVDALNLQKIVNKIGREDSAFEAQKIVEDQAMNFIIPWLNNEKNRVICCAGGFFLNVKFNQRLWETGNLDKQWIYPDCGDGGLAVGAALDAYYACHQFVNVSPIDNVYHGPQFSNSEIKRILDERRISYEYVADPANVAAIHLAENEVVGWFQGRMESGPRALGNRSILMSPVRRENKDIINLRIKYREKFRPFCPSMLFEKRDEYLENSRDEFFMVTSFRVQESKKDKIPAVVHEDQTARPQLVKKHVNPLYYQLIEEFAKLSGEAVVLNTSFNVRGEPIVCNPREAIRCFYDTGIDVLLLGNFLLKK